MHKLFKADSGVARSIPRGGGGVYIYSCSHLKNNRYQKKFINAETEYMNVGLPNYRSCCATGQTYTIYPNFNCEFLLKITMLTLKKTTLSVKQLVMLVMQALSVHYMQ